MSNGAGRACLPAPSFAKSVDDVAKALVSIFPVDLQSPFRAARVPGQESGDDLVVFIDGEMQVADDGAGVEPPVALHLRLDRFMHPFQARTGSRFQNQQMKRAINLENPALLVGIVYGFVRAAD